jgi:cation transport ATPase
LYALRSRGPRVSSVCQLTVELAFLLVRVVKQQRSLQQRSRQQQRTKLQHAKQQRAQQQHAKAAAGDLEAPGRYELCRLQCSCIMIAFTIAFMIVLMIASMIAPMLAALLVPVLLTAYAVQMFFQGTAQPNMLMLLCAATVYAWSIGRVNHRQMVQSLHRACYSPRQCSVAPTCVETVLHDTCPEVTIEGRVADWDVHVTSITCVRACHVLQRGASECDAASVASRTPDVVLVESTD